MARLIKRVMTENGEAQIDYNELANKPDITSIENQLNNEMFRRLGVNPLTKYIDANGIEDTTDNPADSPDNWVAVGSGYGVLGGDDRALIKNCPTSYSAAILNMRYDNLVYQVIFPHTADGDIYHRYGKGKKWVSEGWVREFSTESVIPLANGGTGTANNLVNAPDYAIIRKAKGNDWLMYTETKSGALYATGDNKEPKFGTLPIAQGGTGADNKRDATLNINYLANDPLCDYIKNTTGKAATKNDDKPSHWVEIGPGYAYINGGKDDNGKREAGDPVIMTDYPDEAGDAFLINLVPRKTATIFVRQILLPYNGHIYTRYGGESNTFTPWHRELRNNGTQTIDGGSLVVNRESTGAGVTVNAPLKIDDKNTVNIQSVLGPGYGTINEKSAPRTSVVHHENDKEANRMSLYNDRTIFGQPVTISSGGTGATTKADALANLGAMPKANFKLEGTTLTITL